MSRIWMVPSFVPTTACLLPGANSAHSPCMPPHVVNNAGIKNLGSAKHDWQNKYPRGMLYIFLWPDKACLASPGCHGNCSNGPERLRQANHRTVRPDSDIQFQWITPAREAWEKPNGDHQLEDALPHTGIILAWGSICAVADGMRSFQDGQYSVLVIVTQVPRRRRVRIMNMTHI